MRSTSASIVTTSEAIANHYLQLDTRRTKVDALVGTNYSEIFRTVVLAIGKFYVPENKMVNKLISDTASMQIIIIFFLAMYFTTLFFHSAEIE